MLIIIVAISISYGVYGISAFIQFFPREMLKFSNDIMNLLMVAIIQGLILYSFFKIKRFKDGFSFLQNKNKNDYIDIFILSISALIVFVCFMIIIYDEALVKYIFIELVLMTIIMIIVARRTLTMYYKQKLLERTVKEYENTIKEKDSEIEKVSSEKFNFMKISHQFYNRQQALELKVKEFLNNSNLKAEMGEELEITNKINDLSKEYSEAMQKMEYSPKLQATNIPGVDDIFKYMQSECQKNNIKFNLQINGNINYMVNNIVSQNKLETLIGDHIRDAIIAINSGDNTNRSIIAILGMINDYYEFCVYDSGIEFKIDTLLKLGLEPITTHSNDGGSGIGFVTTFETLEECKASLIIEEKRMNNADYTKAVRIRFNNKNKYEIHSYRADEIKIYNKDSRITIENI